VPILTCWCMVPIRTLRLPTGRDDRPRDIVFLATTNFVPSFPPSHAYCARRAPRAPSVVPPTREHEARPRAMGGCCSRPRWVPSTHPTSHSAIKWHFLSDTFLLRNFRTDPSAPPRSRSCPPRHGLQAGAHTRPLFSSNFSALYGMGGAGRGCVARVEGVLGGVKGVHGVFLCQTRLKLS
jgi:hypothetical protein